MTDKPETHKEKFPYLHLLLSTIISVVSVIILFLLCVKSYDYIVDNDNAVNANRLRILLMIMPVVSVTGALLWLARRSYKNGKRRHMQSYLLTLATGAGLTILMIFILLFLLSGVEC